MRWKRIFIFCALLLLLFVVYVELVNRNMKDMTYRQKILKAFYPTLMWLNEKTGKKNKMTDNDGKALPTTSIYNYSVALNSGKGLKLEDLKGKKILLVNTASNCGYTSQYEELQKLYDGNKDRLMIIAFPANDFKEQEKGSDEEIAEFCKINYGINFPLAKKSVVIKGDDQNPIFKWLTTKELNGWNDQLPTWNFSKYLVDEQGNLIKYFDAGVSPLSEEVKAAVE